MNGIKNLGSAASTGEGWSILLLVLVQAVQKAGWIPADMDLTALVGSIVLVVTGLVFALRKLFRKGSVPFVADKAAATP